MCVCVSIAVCFNVIAYSRESSGSVNRKRVTIESVEAQRTQCMRCEHGALCVNRENVKQINNVNTFLCHCVLSHSFTWLFIPLYSLFFALYSNKYLWTFQHFTLYRMKLCSWKMLNISNASECHILHSILILSGMFSMWFTSICLDRISILEGNAMKVKLNFRFSSYYYMRPELNVSWKLWTMLSTCLDHSWRKLNFN